MRGPAFFLAVISTLGISACGFNSAKQHAVFGDRFWRAGNYAGAVNEYERAWRKDSNGETGLNALFLSAHTQSLFLNQHAEALRKLEILLAGPRDPIFKKRVKNEIADILYLRLDDPVRSRAIYLSMLADSALQLTPEDRREVEFRLAKTSFRLQDFKDANARFRAFLEKYPQNERRRECGYYSILSEYLVLQGEELTGKAKNERLETLSKKLRSFLGGEDKNPVELQIHQLLAEIYEEMIQKDDALREYETILRDFGARPWVLARINKLRGR